MLNCGHSYCEGCLKLLYKPSTKCLQCPSCLTAHIFESINDLNKLIKNYALLSLIETARPTPNDLNKS